MIILSFSLSVQFHFSCSKNRNCLWLWYNRAIMFIEEYILLQVILLQPLKIAPQSFKTLLFYGFIWLEPKKINKTTPRLWCLSDTCWSNTQGQRGTWPSGAKNIYFFWLEITLNLQKSCKTKLLQRKDILASSQICLLSFTRVCFINCSH